MEHYFAWTNGLWLCESATDVKVNFLLYEETDTTGQVKRWTWITNLPLTTLTVEKVMRGGRARWKIENETFNTLKNQGYNFAHNYGHGVKQLATVLALLMLLAFLVDQIQQRFCKIFPHLWSGLGSKAKLWAAIQNVFRVLKFKTMELLYRHIAYLYLEFYQLEGAKCSVFRMKLIFTRSAVAMRKPNPPKNPSGVQILNEADQSATTYGLRLHPNW